MKKSRFHIWITRSIKSDSPISQLSKEHDISDVSMIDIKAIDIDVIPPSKVYFYYSKNAVKYLWQAAKRLNIDLTQSQHACMGAGTASYLAKHCNYNPDFIGKGKPEDVAEALFCQYHSEDICYTRAQQSTQSIQQLAQSEGTDFIVYSNSPRTVDTKSDIDYLLVTSPMNALSFFDQYEGNPVKACIAIGATTAAQLKKLYHGKIVIAAESNELSMYHTLLSLM